ncbi:flagellar motor protein MotB [Sphingomonas floccifaciens]|uniref:Flagellar motor protein MotB n=1 Tax=Sphingomonas floccifaciens TaxID=1844115 RepID=A0ABW4N895_9SPHN
MTIDHILDDEPRRSIWLVTLADVMMLLVGFFVFLQVNPNVDARALSQSMREGFGLATDVPIALEANVVQGFAPGSAVLPPHDIAAWVRAVTTDPRTTVRVTGGTDGTPGDVDPRTQSGAILAVDRARAVAAAIAADVPAGRIAIDTRPGAGRAVQLTISYDGETR